MAERRSALAHLPITSGGGGRVVLSEVRPAAILQVQAWPGTFGTVHAVFGELLGVDAPSNGMAVSVDGVTVAATGPGRFLVCGDAADLVARFEAALPASEAGVTDLSHGRAILRLEGDAATNVLVKGVALDLDPSAFPSGRVAPGMIHHVDVLIHRRGEATFDLWVLRSFAESLAEWLLDAGLEFGISLQGNRPGV